MTATGAAGVGVRRAGVAEPGAAYSVVGFRDWALPVGTAIVLAALATWNSTRKGMSMDEAYTDYTTRLSFPGAIHRALTYELQAPGYFGVLDLWRRIDSSIMFGRALSTIAAVGFVLVMAATARRLQIRRWQTVALASAAVPGVVWAATEMRGYALALLLTATTLYFYVGILSASEGVTRRDSVGYVLSAVSLLYVFHFGGFVLLGQWVGALVSRRRVFLLTGLLALVGCTLLPVVAIIAMQARTHPLLGPALNVGTHFRYALWKTVLTVLQAFTTADSPVFSWPHALIVILGIAVAIPVARILAPRVAPDRFEASWFMVVAVPLVILACLKLFDVVLVHPRHILVAVPGVVLLYALWIDRTRPAALRATGTALIGALLVVTLVVYQTGGPQHEDWRGTAEYVAARAQPGDVVLVYDPDLILPFGRYFAPLARQVRVYGMPVDVNYAKYDPVGNYMITDTAVVAQRVQDVAGAARSIWFVSSRQFPDGSITKPNLSAKASTTGADAALSNPPADMARGQRLVLDYLRAHYVVDSAVNAPGARVDHASHR